MNEQGNRRDVDEIETLEMWFSPPNEPFGMRHLIQTWTESEGARYFSVEGNEIIA